MFRQCIAAMILFVFVGVANAADKEIKATVVKVDIKASKLIVKTADGEKTYDVNAETKFVGPKGKPVTQG